MEEVVKEYKVKGFTREDLDKYFKYDLELGLMWWKERTPDMFPTWVNPHKKCDTWNKKYSGKLVGYPIGKGAKGYLRVGLGGKQLLLHRCLVLLRDGYFIKGSVVDHIDRNILNNRSENLRVVSVKDNTRNKVEPNTTGFSGISRCGKGFKTSISVDGEYIYGGTFNTPEEAHAKYLEMKAEHHKINPLT